MDAGLSTAAASALDARRSTLDAGHSTIPLSRHAGAELFLGDDRALALNLGSSFKGYFKGDCC